MEIWPIIGSETFSLIKSPVANEQDGQCCTYIAPLQWDIPFMDVDCLVSSWWLQVTWHLFGARPSATTILWISYLQQNATCIFHYLRYDQDSWSYLLHCSMHVALRFNQRGRQLAGFLPRKRRPSYRHRLAMDRTLLPQIDVWSMSIWRSLLSGLLLMVLSFHINNNNMICWGSHVVRCWCEMWVYTVGWLTRECGTPLNTCLHDINHHQWECDLMPRLAWNDLLMATC